jgi:Leucine-rich repeat (LRR) protein
MRIRLFSFILLIFISLEIQAQACENACPYYNAFVRMAQADTVKDTQTKLNCYRAAIVAAKDCNCPELEQRVNKQIDTLFVIIEAEKRKAETLSQTILLQQEEIKEALKNAEEANEKNIKIIEAMDFYDGKFALAYKNDKYGFIDKDGNSKLDFKYDRGEPFDKETGFAEMEVISPRSNEATKYLIDTIGDMYELFSLSEEYMIGLRNKIAKNKKQKAGEDSNLESINEELYSDFGRFGTIALDLKDIKKSSALTILKCLAAKENTKNRVEVIIWKGKDLDVFPSVITEFSNLKYIYMYWTEIRSIPLDIDRLTELKRIKLPHGIRVLPTSFYNLESLEILDVSETELKTVPEKVSKLINLREAHFPSTFETLPTSFYNLEKLEILDLFSTNVKVIPKDIKKLENLRSLKLPLGLESLSSSVYDLEKLEYLYIYGADPKDISASIEQLKNLKELTIQVPIETLPESIGTLKKLEELGLSRTRLTTLPESIGHLKSLRTLLLPRSLENLPENIGDLMSLEDLNLYTTNLTRLPESIGNLMNLKELFIPPSLEKLPESIYDLKNLEKFNIRYNQNLKEIPDISRLKKLKHFYYILFDDENHDANLARLKELQEKLPDCDFAVRNEDEELLDIKK